jgi:hypothetical protein
VLPIADDQIFTVSKFQIGYTRWLVDAHGVKAGIGGSGGLSLFPEALRPFYGGRAAGEFAVFLNVRPH